MIPYRRYVRCLRSYSSLRRIGRQNRQIHKETWYREERTSSSSSSTRREERVGTVFDLRRSCMEKRKQIGINRSVCMRTIMTTKESRMSHQHDDRNWEIIEAGKRKRWQTVSGIAAESYRKNRSLPNQSFRFVAEAFCRENRSDTSVLVRTLFPRLKDAKRNKYAALLWTEMSDVWERASCAHALRVAKRAAECTRSLSSATTIPEESAALLTIVERLSSTKTTTDLAMSTFGAMRRNDMVLILFDKIVFHFFGKGLLQF